MYIVVRTTRGTHLDTVTLADDGRLLYDTGAAREMFDAMNASARLPDAVSFEELAGWSNEYVSFTIGNMTLGHVHVSDVSRARISASSSRSFIGNRRSTAKALVTVR